VAQKFLENLCTPAVKYYKTKTNFGETENGTKLVQNYGLISEGKRPQLKTAVRMENYIKRYLK
jgi:hypothetical protein